MREFVCAYCGERFKARKSNARFCDDTCRLRFRRAAERQSRPTLRRRALRATTPKAPIAKPPKTDANDMPDLHVCEPKPLVSDRCKCTICAHPGRWWAVL
jgi:hypothetical protein